jgi:thioredoxin reductase
MPSLNVAVIGAGAAGLVTARELLRAGHAITVFEQSRSIGGVWVYSEEVETDPLGLGGPRIHSSLYRSLRTNLPRDLMAFLDYPFDSSGGGQDEWPRFPGHRCVREYLERFARDFGLLPRIRFDTQVVHVERAGGWRVESVTGPTLRRESFDAVAVCNGHYSEPRVPDLPGARDFPGHLVHSHNYREPTPFVDQRIALLGASASALDLSTEIAAVARVAYCCGDAFAALPEQARVQGSLERRPAIAALCSDGSLRLTDQTLIGPVDTLIFCTGYHYRYPFLAPGIATVEDNWVWPLYHDLLHADHPTLAFVGIPFKVVPFPLFEVQARWFARLLSGVFELPDPESRRAQTAERIASLRAAGVRQRHFHQRSLDCYDYLDALADQSGSPRVPDWHRALTGALMRHAAAHPGQYRDRPLPHFGPTRVPPESIAPALATA